MSDFLTYQDWKNKKNESILLGLRVFLSDFMMKSDLTNAIDKAGEMAGKTIVRELIKSGAYKGHQKVEFERAADLKGTEISVRVEGIKESDALLYLYLAEVGWKKEYQERLSWENKPLRVYILHIITRTRIFRAIYDWWEGRKE